MTPPRTSEVVAVFEDPEKLERAVSELQSHGVDRANLSFLARQALLERRADDMQSLANDPAAPREVVVSDTDLRQGRVLGTGLAATVAAFAAAGFTVATGGVAAAAIAATAAAAGVGAVSTLVGRKLAKDEESFLDTQLARGGVLLWVGTSDAVAERRAADVLRRYSTHVYVHALPAEVPRYAQTSPDNAARLDAGVPLTFK
ncbi:MAG: hypothetical protein JO282_10630 [Alphaproteobacteria bacterium]|nr:hypothetical protein [Alphaproteobacteria bacterium]